MLIPGMNNNTGFTGGGQKPAPAYGEAPVKQAPEGGFGTAPVKMAPEGGLPAGVMPMPFQPQSGGIKPSFDMMPYNPDGGVKPALTGAMAGAPFGNMAQTAGSGLFNVLMGRRMGQPQQGQAAGRLSWLDRIRAMKPQRRAPMMANTMDIDGGGYR
jgi:hypothetical protein